MNAVKSTVYVLDEITEEMNHHNLTDVDDPMSQPRDSGWYPNQVFEIGVFQMVEWRSDRNHLSLEIEVPAGENHLLAQNLLLVAYQGFKQ